MKIEQTHIAGVLIITPQRHEDSRGFFSETFKRAALAEAGAGYDWIQDNHVYSAARGVVRALHFQTPPAAQAKLVRVLRGAVFDVAVDLRKASPTYGRHVGIELSAENWRQLLIPPGFAHGYCTLSEDCEVLYKVDAPYALEREAGLFWADPALGIDWPVEPSAAEVNARDQAWPRFGEFNSPF